MIKKLISGGQTGADRAALDVAIPFKTPHGGWIPKGRKAEDGPLSDKYQLQEMSTGSYPKRTEPNRTELKIQQYYFQKKALTYFLLIITRVLKGVVPNCNAMNDACLIKL